MKLGEIKIAMIEQFFNKQTLGVPLNDVGAVFTSLAESLDVKHVPDAPEAESESGNSSDPSKAFKRFTEGRRAFLTINEEDGFKKYAIFAAVRAGRRVIYEDLTVGDRSRKQGDLGTIKQALKQAKNLNDEVYFSITSED